MRCGRSWGPKRERMASSSMRRLRWRLCARLLPGHVRLWNFLGEEIAHSFAAANKSGVRTLYEDFCGTGARVVVGGLGHAVSSGVEENDEIVRLDGRKHAVAGEEVSGLADRADYVDLRFDCSRGSFDRDDLVVSVVESGTDEVVHAGVGD